MEFNEKLQELRKNKGLTQEELAQALYVSRAAISKWESARGYPSIDSLKEISKFFEVSIDDLLSGEKLLSIAEKENTSNIKEMCDLIYGIVDLCFFLLIILPLYPNRIQGYIYSVNLFDYIQITDFNRLIYWSMYIMLVLSGVVKVLLIKYNIEKNRKILTDISIVLNILLVLFLAMTKEPYALTMAFMLLVIKWTLLFKSVKTGK